MNGGVLMVYYALPGLYTVQPNTDLNTLAGTSSKTNLMYRLSFGFIVKVLKKEETRKIV